MTPLLFSVLLLAADTTAVPTTEAAPAATAEKVKEKKVCRENTSNTGSRMRKKECMTPTEWAKRDAGRGVNDLKNIGGR
jgi:hypothetical protein